MVNELEKAASSKLPSSVPGYRTNEPVNSAYNKQFTASRASGIPFSQQESQYSPPPKQVSAARPSSLSTSVKSVGSTNPQLEQAILQGFGANPSAYGSKDSETYISNLFGQGVLTDADYAKLNNIVSAYNANVSNQNAQIRQTNFNASQKLLGDLTTNINQAKQAGINSVDVLDINGNVIGSINPQNTSQARLQFLNMTKKGAVGLSYKTSKSSIDTAKLQDQVNQTISGAKASGAQSIQIFDTNQNVIDTIPTKDASQVLLLAATVQIQQGKQISLGFSSSKQVSPSFAGPTLGSNPKALATFESPFSEFMRGSNIAVKNTMATFQGLGNYILSGGKAPLPTEHEASLDVLSQSFIFSPPSHEAFAAAGGIIPYYQNIGKTISSNPAGVLGMALPSIEMMIIPVGEIGAGAKSVSNIARAVATKIPLKYAQSIPAYNFIKANFGTEFTQKIFASELAEINTAKLSTQISKINDFLGGMEKPASQAIKTTPLEFLKGTSTETISSLTKAERGLSAFQGALKGQVQQRQEAISALENFAKANPGKVLATKTTPVIEDITKIGPNTFGAFFNEDKSTLAGVIINVGKKGAGTAILISKATPELKTPSNYELMTGVRRTIQKGEKQYAGLKGPQKVTKIQSDVAKFLSGQQEEFEITYPKNVQEPEAILGFGEKTTPEIERFAKAFVPKPFTYAIGKELTFASIRQMTKETPGLLPKELLGITKPNLIESAKTGEIAFARTPIKNVVKDISRLKQPLKQWQTLAGAKFTRLKGFNYLASRFSAAGEAITPTKLTKTSKASSYTFGKFAIGTEKAGAGGIGRATRLARETEKTRNQGIIKQIFAEKDITKPLTKTEKRAIIRETGRRYAEQESKMIKEIPKNILNLTAKATLSERKGKGTRTTTELEVIRYPPNTLPPLLQTKINTYYKQTPEVLLNSGLRKQEKLKMLTMEKTIFKENLSKKITNRSKQNLDVMNILGRNTKVIPVTTGIQISKEMQKLGQPQKTTQKYVYKFPGFPSNPPAPPPPGKKKPPFGGFPFLPNPTQGLGGGGSSEGARRGFIGNVPEFEFTGMYNRPETIYGNPRPPKNIIGVTGKSIKQSKAEKPNSFIFEQKGKSSKKKEGKSLSKRFTNLI